MTLNTPQLEHALRETGERLAAVGVEEHVRLYLVGGAAGLLSGWLAESRATGDVDVTAVEPRESWEAVCRAASEIAEELGLPETWLNNRCRMYAWCLPLGWRERCGLARVFGPMQVWSLDRLDFIAAKVVSAPGRPQDLEDLLALAPTPIELSFAAEHLDRLDREHLDPDRSSDDARAVLRSLRGDT